MSIDFNINRLYEQLANKEQELEEVKNDLREALNTINRLQDLRLKEYNELVALYNNKVTENDNKIF